MAPTTTATLTNVTTVTTTAPGDWRGFRCRDCQKLLFMATEALLTGLSKVQALTIKCGRCGAKNSLIGD